jgi:glyoxylase-like metal-dependent hydrolase (beta-lactamase superfamily II)
MRISSLLLLAAWVPAASASPAPPDVDVEQLAPGVYAVIRREPLGMANHANSLLIVNDSGVVVVDAQFTRAATLEVLAALRRITPKPVCYVVNTHWHDDHVFGNQVYRDSFPNVQFIAQEHTREDLATLGRTNRNGQVQGGPGALTLFQDLLDHGLALDSSRASHSDSAAMQSTLTIARQYLAEMPQFRETLPTLTFGDRLTLYAGNRRIELLWFGSGNTRGDAVVWLPEQRIVATGDLLTAPIPFAFGSHLGDWQHALDAIAALRPVALVPGHGPVMRDTGYLERFQRLLRAVTAETRSAVAQGASLEQVRQRVTLEDFRREFTSGDQWLDWAFTRFFVGPAVAGAFAEATAPSGPRP